MIKIELDNKNVLHIPSGWGDIHLADYEQWFMQQPETKADYVQLVADICKIDVRLLLESPAQLFEAVVQSIEFIFDTNVPPSNKVDINGTSFYISLSGKLTLAEWVDVEATLESESQTKISEILAIVCRPIGEVYDADSIDERKELFRKLPCDKALPLISFFCSERKNQIRFCSIIRRFLLRQTSFCGIQRVLWKMGMV